MKASTGSSFAPHAASNSTTPRWRRALSPSCENASFGDFDSFQPHQVRKRRAVWARLKGIRAAGLAVPEVSDLEIDECARLNSLQENLAVVPWGA